jgi:hypothetical protein
VPFQHLFKRALKLDNRMEHFCTFIHSGCSDEENPEAALSFWYYPESYPDDDNNGTLLFIGKSGKGQKFFVGLTQLLKVKVTM